MFPLPELLEIDAMYHGYNIGKTIPKGIKDLKSKTDNFYGDHLSALRKLVKPKEKDLLKLKAFDKSGIIKKESKFKFLDECFEKVS